MRRSRNISFFFFQEESLNDFNRVYETVFLARRSIIVPRLSNDLKENWRDIRNCKKATLCSILFFLGRIEREEEIWQEKERTRQFERGIFKIQESAASELVRLSSRKGCRRKVTKLEASPISSLSRPAQTRRHGETRILFTIHTLHAHLLDSHFMLFALNCSLRSGVGWVCFHRLEQRTSRDATPVDTHIKIHERFEELSKTKYFYRHTSFVHTCILCLSTFLVGKKFEKMESLRTGVSLGFF